MESKKIVLDTSAFISGVISKKKSIFFSLILEKKVILVISDQIFLEYWKAVHYHKILSRIDDISDLYHFLNYIYVIAEKVEPKNKLNLCRDPEDNKFLEAAYEAKVSYLITLDKDLLDLRNNNKLFKILDHKIKILKPKEFLEEYLRK